MKLNIIKALANDINRLMQQRVKYKKLKKEYHVEVEKNHPITKLLKNNAFINTVLTLLVLISLIAVPMLVGKIILMLKIVTVVEENFGMYWCIGAIGCGVLLVIVLIGSVIYGAISEIRSGGE